MTSDQIERELTTRPVRTAESLAQEHGVSEKTVRRAGTFAEAVPRSPGRTICILYSPPIALFSVLSGLSVW